MVFDNVLDIVSAERGELKKSWFVEWFYGTQEKAYWTQTNHQGSATWAMADSINGGLTATTASAQTRAELNFNNKRHYNFDGAVAIGISKLDVDNSTVAIGLDNLNFTGIQALSAEGSNVQPFFILITRGAGTTGTFTSVPIDTNFHKFRVKIAPTFAELRLDGLLEATSTTNLPTVKLQPFLGIGNNVGGGNIRTTAYRYYEAFNI